MTLVLPVSTWQVRHLALIVLDRLVWRSKAVRARTVEHIRVRSTHPPQDRGTLSSPFSFLLSRHVCMTLVCLHQTPVPETFAFALCCAGGVGPVCGQHALCPAAPRPRGRRPERKGARSDGGTSNHIIHST